VFDHVTMRASDRAASERFYRTVLDTLGVEPTHDGDDFVEWENDFSLVAGPPTEHVHLAFAARDNATVDAFHRAATAAGYRDNGAPGERAEYHAGYYCAYVLDPGGTNVEIVNHNRS
jgi:catechol 2,3-dioxygenase-like lactoylglutathione lyase family enzyme